MQRINVLLFNKEFYLRANQNIFIMKKIFIYAIAVFICASCTNGTTTADKSSDKAQKNIAASDAVTKAFETGDVSKIDSVIAPDFIDHTDQGDKKGPDSLKAAITMMHKSFTDMKMEKVKELADDDYVFSWMRYSGTSDGTMGMAKGPFTMNGVEVIKFNDGKAVEHWGFVNAMEMMKMMPQPAMSSDMNKMDTTKMKK